jgi:hypothetical protein
MVSPETMSARSYSSWYVGSHSRMGRHLKRTFLPRFADFATTPPIV